MNLEELVKAHREVGNKIEELESQKKALSMEIMNQLQGKSMQVSGYMVRRCMRLSIKLSLEEARALNAIKMEETVDREKIKLLYQNGQSVPDVSEIHYIHISALKQQDQKTNK